MDDSDETLMLRAGTGDRTACELLVARHLGRIVTFARRTLGNRSDAEEAAQEVFLRVWSAAPRWKLGTARFSTWLHRVAMNVCLDRLEKKRETLPGELPDIVDERPEPVLALAATEVQQHVNAALARLPDKQRVAVTLCHYQGLRNSEAADVMQISVEALESLLSRARRALRAELRPLAPALMGKG